MSLAFDPKKEALALFKRIENSDTLSIRWGVFIDRHGMVNRHKVGTDQFSKATALADLQQKCVLVGVYSQKTSPAEIETDLICAAADWTKLQG